MTIAPEELLAFRAYAREQTWRAYPRLGLFIAAAIAVWWPLDVLVFELPVIQATYSELRLVVIGLTLVMAAAYVVLPFCRRHPGPIAVLMVSAAAGLTSHYMAIAGDFGEPWFHFLYGMPMLTVPLVAPLGLRLLGAGAVSATVWVAYVATAPDYWGHSLHWAAVSFLTFATLLAVLIGHLGFRLVRSNFVHRLRLEADEQRVRAVNERLNTLVDERTAELRRLAQHLERVREDERRWLAHELHDELGQDLAALRYGVAVAPGAAGDEAAARAHFADLGQTVDHMADTMRRILSGLRPAVLEDGGAVAALRWLVADVSGRGEVAVNLSIVPEDLALDDDRGTAVFRIAQEALTNVLRHARASRAEVRLTAEDGGALTLVVSDDGVGIQPARRRDGMGLVSIRERARTLGGAASWEAREDGGTTLTVTVPVTRQAE